MKMRPRLRNDGKGNIGAVIDDGQAVVASYRYDAFGRLMVKSGTLDQPFQFSTKRYLAHMGLNYYGYRFYSASIGRWINRDPIGEMGGINLYAFVQNNPVNSVDLYGLMSCAAKCTALFWGMTTVTCYVLAAPTLIGSVLCSAWFAFWGYLICEMECNNNPCP